MRTWRGATALAAGCLLLGLVRVVTAPLDELTVIALLVAAGYALAAVVDHRAEHAHHRATDGPSAQHGTPPHRDGVVVSATVVVTPSTRDRIAALVATAAAVVGLLLVLQDRETADHRTPAGPAPQVSGMGISPG